MTCFEGAFRRALFFLEKSQKDAFGARFQPIGSCGRWREPAQGGISILIGSLVITTLYTGLEPANARSRRHEGAWCAQAKYESQPRTRKLHL
jgi:hypothetical protein